MNDLFGWCQNLENLNISHFNTSNVTEMMRLFYNCNSIASLDLTNWNVNKVEHINDMFFRCLDLKIIYCNEDWKDYNINETTAIGMFHDCTTLVGAIAYNSTKTDVNYANPDTGYFTRK